jgi:hypothetical protein
MNAVAREIGLYGKVVEQEQSMVRCTQDYAGVNIRERLVKRLSRSMNE